MNKIIFLGGIPGCGKTTMAYKLALKYHIDKVISLDVLKEIIKIQNNNPYINTTTHEAYKIEDLDVISGFVKHCKIINEQYVKIIKNFSKDKVIIVEGATITEEFVNKFSEYECCYINLYLDNTDMLIERYKSKMKIRCGNWIENIDNILKINDYLTSHAKISLKTIEEVEEVINEVLHL